MMGAEMQISLRYVKAERDRNGKIAYHYFRRTGRRWRLPGEPLSPGFMSAYQQLLEATAPRKPASDPRPVAGSLKALVMEYQRSPEWKQLKPNSQRLYQRIINELVVPHGHKPVALIERRHIKGWRDARSDTPGMANMVVAVARILMTFAVDADYRKDNPAFKIKTFKLGEHRAWTAEELERFETCWAPGTMQRRAYVLARYTGQRCIDLAAMTRAHRRSGRIHVT